jgi:hypothetical protein
MPNDIQKVTRFDVLPPEPAQLRMPAGTPLGVGILGAARFSAIRRVLEHAAQAKASYLQAQTAVTRAYIGLEAAREELLHLDTIRDDVADRIQEGARIAKMQRQLERLEMEERLAAAQARSDKRRGATDQPANSHTQKGDEFSELLSELEQLPRAAKAVAAAKEQIVRNAGGEEELSDADRAVCDMLDAMLQAFISKRTSGMAS